MIQNRHLERINAKSTKVDDEVRGRPARFPIVSFLMIYRSPLTELVWTVFIEDFVPALLGLVNIIHLRLLL